MFGGGGRQIFFQLDGKSNFSINRLLIKKFKSGKGSAFGHNSPLVNLLKMVCAKINLTFYSSKGNNFVLGLVHF